MIVTVLIASCAVWLVAIGAVLTIAGAGAGIPLMYAAALVFLGAVLIETAARSRRRNRR